MLSYLVKSSVRRKLLKLLWREKQSGSISSLARRAGLSFSATHKELAAMKLAGLAISSNEGKNTVYRPNLHNPCAGILKKLLSETSKSFASQPGFDKAEVLANLGRLGLPIVAGGRSTETTMPAEIALARALVLAHHDPTLAKALPVLLHKLADRLDMVKLVKLSKELGQKSTLGFFLQLTEFLSGRSELSELYGSLKDNRLRQTRNFFSMPSGRYSRKLAEKNTPEIARDWFFTINMPISSFQAFFNKHSSSDE